MINVPSLFIHGNACALPDNLRRFYSLVSGPKDLHWSSSGAQADYYDQQPYVNKAVSLAALHFREAFG